MTEINELARQADALVAHRRELHLWMLTDETVCELGNLVKLPRAKRAIARELVSRGKRTPASAFKRYRPKPQ